MGQRQTKEKKMFCTAKKVKLKVAVAQSCLPLCDPMEYTVRAILQA